MTTDRAASMPDNAWGRWGPDDERGALNLLTPQGVQDAAAAVKTGKAYALGIPVQRSGSPNFDFPRGIPQRLTLANHADEHQLSGSFGAPEGRGANEDMLIFASHTATHLDALCHIYDNREIYNGFAHDGMTPFGGAPRCGIEKVGAIAGRGVLIDVAEAHGVAALEPGYIITDADFRSALEKQGTALRAGDLVLVRTGWMEKFVAGEAELWQQPGIGSAAARFLVEADIALVGADNSAVESIPFEEDDYLRCHTELLVRRGIYLLEQLNLAELASDQCYEFLLTIGALKITGATASPVNPIAIG